MSRFLSLRKSQGSAPRTLTGYKEFIEQFFRRFPMAWSTTCRECLAEFLAQENIAIATHNIRLKSLKPFFDFTVSEGAFTESPAADFKYRRGEEPRIVDHPIADLKKMLDTIGTSTFAALRDTTLFLFCLDSGIRPSEALRLLPADIDTHLQRAVIRASTAKTRHRRTVYFSETTASMLDRLLNVRPEEWGDDVSIFCTSYGEPWNAHGWTVKLRRYAKKAGLKRFSAYDLRHQFALESLRNGMDVFSLQKAMGHSTLSMTERYLALSDDDVQRAHRKASPVSAMYPATRKRIGRV